MRRLLLVFLLASPAVQADIQPGEWEMTVLMQMEGMPQPVGPIVKKQCLSAEDARDPSRVLGSSTGGCEFSNRRDDGGLYQFDLYCGGQIVMRGAGSVRYGAQSVDADVNLVAEVGGKKVGSHTHMTGRLLAPCSH